MQLIFLLLTFPPCYQKDMTQVGFTVLRRKKLILDQVQRQLFFFYFLFFIQIWCGAHSMWTVNGWWAWGPFHYVVPFGSWAMDPLRYEFHGVRTPGFKWSVLIHCRANFVGCLNRKRLNSNYTVASDPSRLNSWYDVDFILAVRWLQLVLEHCN